MFYLLIFDGKKYLPGKMTNKEFNEFFRTRTQKFALDIIELIDDILFTNATRILSYQLGKSGTSVGANFRAFCRARSQNERFAKICIVVEEGDESIYWLEILEKSKYGNKSAIKYLLSECTEILKVTGKIKDNLYTI